MFVALKKYCHGEVLDVGGADFVEEAIRRGLQFDKWTTLDASPEIQPRLKDPRYTFVLGDGCDMSQFCDGAFDTVLCLQVAEHVFEPIRLFNEVARVTKPGGHAMFLAPQTGVLHHAPHHYYNFTRYWFTEACKRAGLEVVQLSALGGMWSSVASRFFYFFVQSARYPGYHIPEERRSLRFYALWPFMALYSVLSIPLCLLLSLGDSAEEPNNHLVVARKPVDSLGGHDRR
jgi:SAM-dependent methyltransferase